MDHVQNEKKLCQCLAILSDCSLENRSCNAFETKNPKSLILIWDNGASFGLTPFRSDFIDYVETDITVKDVTKINKVIGIGTMLHKFKNEKGKDVFSPACRIIYLKLMCDSSLHKLITKCTEAIKMSVVTL